jgi:hypothetical protein
MLLLLLFLLLLRRLLARTRFYTEPCFKSLSVFFLLCTETKLCHAL